MLRRVLEVGDRLVRQQRDNGSGSERHVLARAEEYVEEAAEEAAV